MEGKTNYLIGKNLNSLNNYFSHTDNNNFDKYQEKTITSKAKETIKNFKNQYLLNNNNNSQRIVSTEANQISQKYPGYQMISNKVREELNSYDYYFSPDRNLNKKVNITKKQNVENKEHNIDIMNQENTKLKKQLLDLVLENKNLQNRINNNYPSPILIKNNNFSDFNSVNRQEKISRDELDNNIYNNNNYNIKTVPSNDQKFLEQSMESIIKTNLKLGQNNNDARKNIFDLKQMENYKMGYLRTNNNNNINNYSNKNFNNYNNTSNLNINPNEKTYSYPNFNNINQLLNNNNNDNRYVSLMNDYNQLSEDYKSNKIQLDNVLHEMENKKGLSNKYRILTNNYNDLQNRNKELILTIQKMKNDNSVLTRHVEDLTRQKKNLENNLSKTKKGKNNNNSNINELKTLRNKYIELQKYIENIMKEKQEVDKNERKKKK